MRAVRLGGWIGFSAVLLCVALSSRSAAEEHQADASSSSQQMGCCASNGRGFPRPLTKLGRGLGNVAFGWLEVPQNLDKGYAQRPDDVATGLFTGTLVGLGKTVERMGVGVYETLTFWLPAPAEYEPILPPLKYFKTHRYGVEPVY